MIASVGLAVVCANLLAAQPTQDPRSAPLVIPRLTGPVVLDGPSDEPAWQAIAPLQPAQSSPVHLAPPSERTEFRLARDDRYLYAAGRMYDSAPRDIRATSLRRDDGSFSNDWFVVNIDGYNDKETMLVFGVTPAGVRTDVVFNNDAQTAPNFSYNTFWDAAVKQTSEGWFAEIRIPLSSLRFVERDGRTVIGVTIWRRIARRNEMIAFPAVSPEWGTFSIFKASQAQEMVLEDIDRRTPVYLTPYLLAGDGIASKLPSGASAYVRTADSPREMGADLKYGITSDLTLDVTYNTDFAQVEADDQQVNLTRFSLFFPEKRTFFQERSGLFELSTGPSEQLFYSRRIGLSGGTPVPLYGGVRVVGRAAGWDIGALDMVTKPVPARALPTTNYGVLRARRQLLNANSYVGALVTARHDSASRNVVTALDALLRLRAQDYLTLQAGHTTDDDTTGASSLERLMMRAFYERRGQDGLSFGIGASRFGALFNPAMGYLQRTNFLRGGGRLHYGWLQPASSRALRYSMGVNGFALRRNLDGRVETVIATAQWVAEMKSGRVVTLAVPFGYEELLTSFILPRETSVPPGVYRWPRFTVDVTAPSGHLRRADLFVGTGRFYDGRSHTASVAPTWVVSSHLELSGLYQVDRVEFPARNQRFTAHVARIRARTALNAALSFAAFVQYNSASDIVVTNARLRFNPREGTDLYVVYNDSRNTDILAYDPVRFALDSRTLLVKFARTIHAEF